MKTPKTDAEKAQDVENLANITKREALRALELLEEIRDQLEIHEYHLEEIPAGLILRLLQGPDISLGRARVRAKQVYTGKTWDNDTTPISQYKGGQGE